MRCEALKQTPPFAKSTLQPIQGADRVADGLVDVGVDHRRLQVPVTKQQLDGPDVGPLSQQMGREGVAQRMNAGMLLDMDLLKGELERLLDVGL